MDTKTEIVNSADGSTGNGKDTSTVRAFLFRNVPEHIHRRWKLLSSILGISMEEFGVIAIEGRMESEVRRLLKEVKTI